jgi:hypothetical protein
MCTELQHLNFYICIDLVASMFQGGCCRGSLQGAIVTESATCRAQR